MPDLDALSKLQVASFRGVKFPILSRSCEHLYENVEHGIQYRNGMFVDTTGGRNWQFKYTIPFRQGVAVGPWADLFTQGLPAFLKLYQEALEGELVDPIHGTVRVRPGSWSETLDAARRDGMDVEVMFTESPPIEQREGVQQVPSPASVDSAAGLLDAQVQTVDWQQYTPPEPTVNPLDAIAGVVDQVDAEQSRTAARMSGISDRCDRVSRAAEKVEDGGDRASLLIEASRLRVSAKRAADKGAHPGRTAAKVIVTTTMSLASLARTLGMTLEDLLRANPALGATPSVTPGTEVWKS